MICIFHFYLTSRSPGPKLKPTLPFSLKSLAKLGVWLRGRVFVKHRRGSGFSAQDWNSKHPPMASHRPSTHVFFFNEFCNFFFLIQGSEKILCGLKWISSGDCNRIVSVARSCFFSIFTKFPIRKENSENMHWSNRVGISTFVLLLVELNFVSNLEWNWKTVVKPNWN